MTAAATTANTPRPITGYVGLAAGAMALLLVLVPFWAGPFAPRQDITVSVGTIAAKIRLSAKRALKGEPPTKPVATSWTIDRILKVIAAVLAAAAVVLGLTGWARGEPWRPAAAGIGVATAAIAFQFFAWAVMVVLGVLLLIAIIQNIDGILGDVG